MAEISVLILQMKHLRTKWEMIVWGFTVFSNAIYFRLTLEDNIDRLAFFEELSAGYIEMQDEYMMNQPTLTLII